MSAVSSLPAPSRLLDGHRFDGVVLECGKTVGDAESITFEGGRFRSSACDPYAYGDGVKCGQKWILAGQV